MNGIKIIGVGKFLPGKPITNLDMEKIFGIREDWIEEVIGTKTRYFATDLYQKKIQYQLADISVKAATEAVGNARV